MFVINGIEWNIVFIQPKDIRLTRSDGSKTIGMTDSVTHCIYLSNRLYGAFLERVLCHELCHAVCMSWNISIPIESEEWLCNFIADHGKEIIYLLDDLLSGMLRRIA